MRVLVCRVCGAEHIHTRGRPRQYCSGACADYAHALERYRRASDKLVQTRPDLSSPVASEAFVLVHEVRSQARRSRETSKAPRSKPRADFLQKKGKSKK